MTYISMRLVKYERDINDLASKSSCDFYFWHMPHTEYYFCREKLDDINYSNSYMNISLSTIKEGSFWSETDSNIMLRVSSDSKEAAEARIEEIVDAFDLEPGMVRKPMKEEMLN